jgi:3-keto-L-gulonate-6-phosphate decarboxylase
VVAVLGPVAPDDLNRAVVPLDGKLEPDDVVAGADLVERPDRMIGVLGGISEHPVHLSEKAERRVVVRGRGVRGRTHRRERCGA